MNKKIVIGMGTGRCGTTSLAALFNKQESFVARHEIGTYRGKKPRWGQDFSLVLKRFNKVVYAAPNAKYACDIGFYWLPHVEDMMNEFEDIKFVSIRREFKSWLTTYVRAMRARNYMVQNPKYFKPSPWDGCFPIYAFDDFSYIKRQDCKNDQKYGHKIRIEAATRYWNEYYQQSKEWEKKYPEQFKLFEMEEVLKNAHSCKPMFDFIGVENPVYEFVWVNARFTNNNVVKKAIKQEQEKNA